MKVLGETGMDVLVEEIKKRTAGGDGNDGATNHLIPWEYLIKNEPSQAFNFYQIVCKMCGLVQHLTSDDFHASDALNILNSDNPAGNPMSGGPEPVSWKNGFAPRTLEDLITNLYYRLNQSENNISSLLASQAIGIYQYNGKLCRYLMESSNEIDTQKLYPIDGFADDELITDYVYFEEIDISYSDSYSTELIENIFNGLKAGSMVFIRITRNNNENDNDVFGAKQYSNRVLLYMIGNKVYGVYANFYQSEILYGYANIYIYDNIPHFVGLYTNCDGAVASIKSFNKAKTFKAAPTSCNRASDLPHILNVFSGRYGSSEHMID